LAWHTAIGLGLAMWHAKFVWQKHVWGLIKVHDNAWPYVSGLRILPSAEKALLSPIQEQFPWLTKLFLSSIEYHKCVDSDCGLLSTLCGASFLKLFTTFDLHSRISAFVLQTL
jgi:hypothetical protein